MFTKSFVVPVCIALVFYYSVNNAQAQEGSKEAVKVVPASVSEVAIERSSVKTVELLTFASPDNDTAAPQETKAVVPASAQLCPAVNCDCGAITLSEWRERCIAAELTVKQACVANQGVPTRYCTLHGPAAMPVAIVTERPAVKATTLPMLRLYKRQVIMLLWSVKDDLDNVQRRENELQFGDALQVHKLLDRNVERLYLTQRRAAEGERLRVGDDEAEEIWQDYRKELADLVEHFSAYSKLLWSNMQAATDVEKQKAYRVLAMRVGRTASTLSEHYALAYAGEGSAEGAAKAWQQSARLAADLMAKEIASSNNAQRIAYYRNQSAARWNRASFYWMDAKESAQIAKAVAEAERLLAVE